MESPIYREDAASSDTATAWSFSGSDCWLFMLLLIELESSLNRIDFLSSMLNRPLSRLSAVSSDSKCILQSLRLLIY